ncbi:MAG: HD-GYP domain-containing protein [Candidatus Omnitrophica bacterium]|nr:HD-GYP domain-containing protein [Candidatus Omnitrophota bacterium]
MLELRKENFFISNTFKISLVGIIFFLTFFHLYSLYIYPRHEVISQEILLGVVLTLLGYLWIQELRDRYRLQEIAQTLVRARQELERAEVNAITTLVLSEEAKDPYMRGHSKRVTRCAMEIAKEVGLDEDELKVIERAGLLHDLGKIGISDTILHKPDKLTPDEWIIIKKHPRRAVEILEPLSFLDKEKDLICHHHERFDGKGYPDGIKGEAIPLGSRILSVADSFDAMNSERAYRKPIPEEKIVQELKDVSGSQLDPAIVNNFLELLKRKPSLWERT